MNQRQIEIFTADCTLCDETVNTVIGQAGRGVQVPPYNGGISPLETPASLTVKLVQELACSSCQVSV